MTFFEYLNFTKVRWTLWTATVKLNFFFSKTFLWHHLAFVWKRTKPSPLSFWNQIFQWYKLSINYPRTMDAQWSLFSLKFLTFGLGQTNSAAKFWGVFQPNYQHPFWYCESLVHIFYNIQPLFLQKTKPLYPHSKYLFGIGIWIWAAKN